MKKLVLTLLILCTIQTLCAQSKNFFTPTELRQINKIIISSKYCDTARAILTNQVKILDQKVLLLEGKSLVILEDVKILEDYNSKLTLENTNLQKENQRLNRKLTTFKIGFGVLSLVTVGSVAYFLIKK